MHPTDIPARPLDVRFEGQSGKHMLALSPGLTQPVKRARAENAQNCFLPLPLSTATASAVLFLFNVIETNAQVRRRSFHTGWTQSGRRNGYGGGAWFPCFSAHSGTEGTCPLACSPLTVALLC
jgi:hypothetical protein